MFVREVKADEQEYGEAAGASLVIGIAVKDLLTLQLGTQCDI